MWLHLISAVYKVIVKCKPYQMFGLQFPKAMGKSGKGALVRWDQNITIWVSDQHNMCYDKLTLHIHLANTIPKK